MPSGKTAMAAEAKEGEAAAPAAVGAAATNNSSKDKERVRSGSLLAAADVGAYLSTSRARKGSSLHAMLNDMLTLAELKAREEARWTYLYDVSQLGQVGSVSRI